MELEACQLVYLITALTVALVMMLMTPPLMLAAAGARVGASVHFQPWGQALGLAPWTSFLPPDY